MKRRVYEFAMVLVLSISFMSSKPAVGWWSLVYPPKSFSTEIKDEKNNDFRFFIFEWLQLASKQCKINISK